MRGARLLAPFLLALAAAAAAQDDYTFDVERFERKPFELGGFVQGSAERQRLDPEAALYPLRFPGAAERYNDRLGAALEVGGIARRDALRAQFLARGEYADDLRGSGGEAKFYEAFGAWQVSPRAAWEAGKRTQRWGKGYAWNPVGFLERPKDPEDPELAREGFGMLLGNFVHSAGGALQNISFTPVLVPTFSEINSDFGARDHWNPAAKLSLLYRDTDLDFLWLGSGSREARYGFGVSRNLATHIEVHGEWARVRGPQQSTSYLVGTRYLTERETTWIVEYYRNGAGFSEADMRQLFAAPHPMPGLARANPMRRYLYVRAIQKEPFGILYFTPGAIAIVNLQDRSASLIGELVYTGFANVELRLRAGVNRGARLTEFGEKPVDARVELRARYYF
jgi:hypothetical protein